MPFDPESNTGPKAPFKSILKPTTKPTLEPGSGSQVAPKSWSGGTGNALKSGLAAARAPSQAPLNAPTGPRNKSVAMADLLPRGPRITSVVMGDDGRIDAPRSKGQQIRSIHGSYSLYDDYSVPP
ncbi:hypothetical protein Q7P35_003547 [Cladosporium inversicolor]